MNFLIRNAKAEDYEAVLEIMNQVQQMHVEWRPDIYKENDCILLKEEFNQLILANLMFVAENAGKIAGVLGLQFRHIENPYQKTRNIIFIDSMAVAEEFRGKGIGHLFFEKVKQIKAEKNFDGIELQVNARNAAAYQMYKNYGFTEKSINMELL